MKYWRETSLGFVGHSVISFILGTPDVRYMLAGETRIKNEKIRRDEGQFTAHHGFELIELFN